MNEHFRYHRPANVFKVVFAWLGHFIIGFVVIANGSGAAFAQSSLPLLPKDTEFILHFEDPAALVSELAWLRSEAENDDRLKEVIIGERFPLLPPEGLPVVFEALKSIEEILHQMDCITLAVGKLNQDPFYLLLIKVEDSKIAESLENLQSAWQAISSFRDSIPPQGMDEREKTDDSIVNPRAPKQSPPIDLVSETSKWTSLLLPRTVKRVGEFLIVSNSNEWHTWMEQALTNADPTIIKSSLQQSRRFQRSIALLSKNQQRDGFCWFLPYTVFPLWDPKLTQEALKNLGYEELVGASVEFDFGSHAESRYRFRLKMSVPFTVPEQGIVRLWKAYQPIEKIPPIADYIANSQDRPWKVSMTNLDRVEYIRIDESIYRENGEMEKFDEKYRAGAEYHPSVENYKSLYDGASFRLTMLGTVPEPQYYSLDFKGIGNQEAAAVYFPFFAETSSKTSTYRMEEVDFSGFPGLSYSKENNLKKAKRNFGRSVNPSERHLLRNPGIVLTPRWIVNGDREQMREYFERSTELEVDAATEFDRIFPIGNIAFASISPTVLDISFPDRWLHEVTHEYRFKYLSTRMSLYKARELVYGTENGKPRLDFVPIENTSDRVFSAWDWGLNSLLNRYNSGIQMFSPQDQHFEWHWYIFEKK